jgi:NitT/TauT family transport system substrate-binding protein
LGRILASMKILTLAVALGCLLPVAPAQSATTTIRVANLELGTNLPIFYLAKIASKYDIDVKVINFRRGVETAQALKANEVDVALGGTEAAISAAAGGSQVVILSNYCSGGIAWVTRPDLNLKSVSDVKGLRFGTVRGIHELLMLIEFDRAGITWSEQPGKANVQLVFLNSGPAIAAALKSRQIDVMTNAEPLPSRAIQEGYGAQFHIPNTTAVGNPARAVFMRRDFFDAHKDAARRFVEALVEATKKLRDDPAFAREFAVNEALKGSITAEDWDLMFKYKHTSFDVMLSLPSIQATADYMRKFGMIQRKVDAAEFTDLSLVEAAAKKVGW